MNSVSKSSSLQAYTMLLVKKAVHPEFFGIESRRRIEHGDFDVEAWIFRGGHVVRFQQRTPDRAIATTRANGRSQAGLSLGAANGARSTVGSGLGNGLGNGLGDGPGGASDGAVGSGAASRTKVHPELRPGPRPGLRPGLSPGPHPGQGDEPRPGLATEPTAPIDAGAESPARGDASFGGDAAGGNSALPCICEIVSDQPEQVPDRGVLGSFPCAGERDHEERVSRRLLYMTTIQTETLSEHLYVGTYKEMMQHGRETNSLVSAWTDELGRPNLSLVDLQRLPNEVHVQAYHLRSDCGLVLRTQSMVQIDPRTER